MICKPKRSLYIFFLNLVIVLGLISIISSGGGSGGKNSGNNPNFDEIETIMPEETADSDSLKALSNWAAIPIFQDGIYHQCSSEDRRQVQLIPEDSWLPNGNKDMNNFICANNAELLPGVNSYPINLDESTCLEDYIRGYVMARYEGSGRLVRVWIVTTSQAASEVLRIYIDDKEIPFIQARLADVFSGEASEIFQSPFSTHTPTKFVWFYPVVFASKFIMTIDRVNPSKMFYYQVDAVIDDDQTDRQADKSRCDERDVAISLLNLNNSLPGEVLSRSVALAASEAFTVFDLPGPATIQSCTIRFNEQDSNILQKVDFAVAWDNADDPAIDIPLLDFFAASLFLPENTSLALCASRNDGVVEISLNLPMPFAERSLWVVTNHNVQSVSFELELVLSENIPKDPYGLLLIQRFDTLGPTLDLYHPLAAVSGQGRLVGVCLMMEGHGLTNRFKSAFTFLEGDELGIIDGVKTIGGTGTEDYFNSAWYFSSDNEEASPFAQWWGVKQTGQKSGDACACRWHILSDAIDFKTELELSIEIGPGQPYLLDRYRSVAFIYHQ